jgi:hypothetical protein
LLCLLAHQHSEGLYLYAQDIQLPLHLPLRQLQLINYLDLFKRLPLQCRLAFEAEYLEPEDLVLLTGLLLEEGQRIYLLVQLVQVLGLRLQLPLQASVLFYQGL